MNNASHIDLRRLVAPLLMLVALVSHPDNAAAQIVTNPRVLEFAPSGDHNTILPDGRPAIDHYEVAFYYQGTATPFQTASIGKPAPGTNGLIRVDLSATLSMWPLSAGTVDEARVAAVGPAGTGQSSPSNPFSFSGACAYALSATTASIAAAGGSASVTVTVASGCAWTSVSNAPWITVTLGSTLTGTGFVNLSVAANQSGSPRTGTVTVAGQEVTITQAGASCAFALSSATFSLGAGAGTGSVGVTGSTGCTWTAGSNSSWLTITSGSSGTGSATVGFSATANPSASPRTGTLTVAGQIVTVTQAASSCTYSLSTTTVSLGATAGSGMVGVTAGTTCTWAASSSASWLAITSGSSGTGTGSVSFSAAANPSASPRTTTMTIAGQGVAVTQAGGSCSFALSTTGLSVGSGGGTASVAVSTLTGCAWSAASNTGWITVTGGSSGSGSGTVTVSVAANTSAISRTGTLTIAGQTVTVTQPGNSCTYTLSSAGQSFTSAGGVGSVAVTASGAQCSWTASSAAAWLTITTGVSGTGSATVSYAVAPNSTGTDLTGTLSIAGLTYTVTIAAATTTPTIVKVRSESQLQAAVQALTSNTTIELAAGIYPLTRTLALAGALRNVTLRGSTGNPGDVTLVGMGMNTAAYGNVVEGISTTGAVEGLTIADLTIRDVYLHAVHLGPGARAPRLSNLRLVNAGQAFVRADLDPVNGGVPGGVVEGSLFERTAPSRDAITTAVDVRGGANWRIRRNVFRNLVAPAGQMGAPAVLMTAGSSGTITEQNTFLNCQRGIAYGWTDVARFDHAGGIIRNNFYSRTASQPGEAAILVVDSPGTEVLQNTAILSGTYPTPIEYRYPDTVGVIIANNLLDGMVWARDGAMGQDTANDGSATPAYFVDAAGGNLHLAAGSPAIDRGALLPDALTDWDGDPRPAGGAVDMGADEAAPPNRPPTVAILSPADGSTIATPAIVQLSAAAADSDGRVVRVEFYAGSALVGSAGPAPFAVNWRLPKQSGSIQITAVAVDNAGARSTAAPVTVIATRKGQ